MSETFAEPFPTVRRIQARLGQLAASGLLHAWRYATTGQESAPHYYKLSGESFRLVFGDKAMLPSKRFPHEVKVSQQEHKRLLATSPCTPLWPPTAATSDPSDRPWSGHHR